MRTGFFLLLILLSTSVKAQSCRSLQSLDWMVGNWTAIEGLSLVSETWQRVSADSIEGEFTEMDASSGELEASESLRLLQMSGEIFYLAKVSQNDYPVPFRATSCSSSGAVFENPEHDAPKRIEYTLVSESEIRVQVSNGDDEGLIFNFSRVN